MGDDATRHRSALCGTEPYRVMTHHNKRLKFESIIVMGHDAARLCTEQCRVAPCRAAPIQSKTKLLDLVH